MAKHRKLWLEEFEQRDVPSVFGHPWNDPTRVSVSFAPDGTSISGQSSTLFAAFEGTALESSWQQTILQAFQTWTAPTNLNFGVRQDSGDPFGTAGLDQHGQRLGKFAGYGGKVRDDLVGGLAHHT